MRITRKGAAVAVAALAVMSAGCGDDEAEPADTTEATASVEVTGAWARSTPMNAENGAAYMQLTASADDSLVGASVDPAVAGTAELHETVAVAEGSSMDGGSSTTMEGMGEMTMRPVESIDLPAGETVALEPGGLHIMLLELAAPLETGSTFDLTLDFAETDDQTVTVEVREEAP